MGFDPDNTWSAGEVLYYTADTMPSSLQSYSVTRQVCSRMLRPLRSLHLKEQVVHIASRINSVAYGGTPTYMIAPTSGYSVANVFEDGSLVGTITSYTFLTVTAPRTLSATGAANSVIPASRVYLNSVKNERSGEWRLYSVYRTRK